MEILKNKWFWIVISVVVLIIIMRKNKGSLASMFGVSDNYDGFAKESHKHGHKNHSHHKGEHHKHNMAHEGMEHKPKETPSL